MRLESILRKSQKELKQALVKELTLLGYRPHTRKGYIYAKGTIPVLLVAHLDTVHHERVKTICYSSSNILMSPEGIGGDDRAGVYMVLQILKEQRCHVLFCEDEEVGCLGAIAFTEGGVKPAVNYIVELDRRGSNDAVFYDCANPDFTKFVCSFGFEEDFGTFSDIAVIAPHLGVAAVNISAGYYSEHTMHEHINLVQTRRNIEKVSKMIATPTEKFEYIESRMLYMRGYEDTRVLSPTPESAYFIDQDGEIIECSDSLWIDSHGVLYEYFCELGVAVELAGCSVFTETGMPVRFNSHHAELVEIVPLEYIYDCI